MIPALSFENLVSWCAQVAIIASTGAAALKVFRLHQPRIRLKYCYTLLLLFIALPFAQPLWQDVTSTPAAVPRTVATGTVGFASVAVRGIDPIRSYVIPILLTGIAARFGLFLAGALRIRRYRRAAVPLHFPKESILSLFQLIHRDVEVGVSANEVGPVTFGWFRPFILLPSTFLSLDEEAQRAILCHELLHVVRHDWLANLVEETIGACLWFHPAIWWLLSQTKLAREQVVDAEVVRLTSARESYVEALLAIAGTSCDQQLIPASSFLRRRHLVTRLESLLRDRRDSRTRVGTFSAATVAVLVWSSWTAMSSFPLMAQPRFVQIPPSAPAVAMEAPQVYTIGEGVTAPKVLKHIEPEYSDAARAAGVQGMVVLECVVEPDGTVDSVKVTKELDPDLDHNAVIALQQWTFEPGRRDGKPVAVRILIEINYRLKV